MIDIRKLLKFFLFVSSVIFCLLLFSSGAKADTWYACKPSDESTSYWCASGWTQTCNCTTNIWHKVCAEYYVSIHCTMASSPCVAPSYRCDYNRTWNYTTDSGTCTTCGSCTPSTPANYTSTNTGCSSTTNSCTRFKTGDCSSTSCGTTTATFWLVKKTATYNANGGTCSPTSQQTCYGSSTSGTSCSRSGYIVSNFSITSGSCYGTFNSATGGCSNLRADITVRANWVLNQFTVTYDANGGSCTPTSRVVTYNSTAAAPSCTKSGYVTTSFVRTVGSGGTLNTSTGEVTNVTGDQTIQARWGAIPTAPTVPYCNGTTNPTNVITSSPTFSAIFNDPDSGDTGKYYEIEVNTSSAFTGTVMWDSGIQSMTTTTNGTRSPNITYAGSSLNWTGTTYYWRIRFGDSTALMSPWSSTQNFTMHTNANAPTATYLQVEQQTNPIQVVDTKPEFRAQFDDADSGETGVYYEIEVNTASDFTGTVMWDTGLQSMTAVSSGSYCPEVTYGSTDLAIDGTKYYWRIRFGDNFDTVGSWSATAEFTMNNPPTVTLLTTESETNPKKIYDMTPEFSGQFNDLDSGATGNSYEIDVNTASDFSGTVMWNGIKTAMTPISSGSRSPEISYAGTTLTSNGQIYYWRMKMWDSADTESAWSSTGSFRTTVVPSKPTGLLLDGQTNPLSFDSLTPTMSAVYTDLNEDDASYYEIEVNSNNTFTGTVMWDTGKLSTTVSSGTRSPNYTYGGTALSGETGTRYYWRIRFWDVDDTVSEWSDVNYFEDRWAHFLIQGVQIKGMQFK